VSLVDIQYILGEWTLSPCVVAKICRAGATYLMKCDINPGSLSNPLYVAQVGNGGKHGSPSSPKKVFNHYFGINSKLRSFFMFYAWNHLDVDSLISWLCDDQQPWVWPSESGQSVDKPKPGSSADGERTALGVGPYWGQRGRWSAFKWELKARHNVTIYGYCSNSAISRISRRMLFWRDNITVYYCACMLNALLSIVLLRLHA
jgi:hypothetical protein